MMAWKGVRDDHGIYFTTFRNGGWQPQGNVPGVGTDRSPAICQDIGGGPRLLWKGIGGDSQLWTTYAVGNLIWQPQSTLTWNVPGNGGAGVISRGTAGTYGHPSVALVGGIVQAAWRGVRGDSGLWFTQLANDLIGGNRVLQWSGQANVPNVGSSEGASITSFQGRLYMAWKGIDGDSGIYLSRL